MQRNLHIFIDTPLIYDIYYKEQLLIKYLMYYTTLQMDDAGTNIPCDVCLTCQRSHQAA